MKRRNADCGKMRRPIKRNKITEGIYGSTLLYLKFLLLWALVILADFLLEFRFEFLWPFWLLLRSVHDSFKYQGLAFSVLFVCIALTSDLVCLFFIPVDWIFLLASTYVWVQYVWHTDKGVCLPTIILWMLFVYLEAAVRWRDLRHLPVHLDLCRPFAAHCIGYPVVTMGFGFKSYVGFRMRQRRQRDVAKENDFYLQLLQQALPQETPPQTPNMTECSPPPPARRPVSTSPSPPCSTAPAVPSSKEQSTERILHNGHITSNGVKHHRKSMDKERASCSSGASISGDAISNKTENSVNRTDKHEHNGVRSDHNHVTKSEVRNHVTGNHTNSDCFNRDKNDNQRERLLENTKTDSQNQLRNEAKELPGNKSENAKHDHKDAQKIEIKPEPIVKEISAPICTEAVTTPVVKIGRIPNGGAGIPIPQDIECLEKPSEPEPQEKTTKSKSRGATVTDRRKAKERQKEKALEAERLQVQEPPAVCEACLRSETEIKRLRSELHSSRQAEGGAKAQDRACRAELAQAHKDNDEMQTKLQSLGSTRQALLNAERRAGEERRLRLQTDTQLNSERKQRKALEERITKGECTESCRARRQALENDNKALRRELQAAEERGANMEQHGRALDQQVRSLEAEARAQSRQHGAEVLMGALAAMQDKNSHLEHSLSAETRIKLDLFSALGEANRKLEIRENLIRSQEKELAELKSRLAQVLAVMPPDSFGPPCSTGGQQSKMRLADTPPLMSCQSPTSAGQMSMALGLSALGNNNNSPGSTLDPNATAYTPKNNTAVGNEV